MHDDVFDESWGHHHDAPVEAQSAVRGAAPPASALVPYEYAPPFTPSEPGPPAINPGLQPLSRPFPIPFHERAAYSFMAFVAMETPGNGDLNRQ